MAKSINHIEKVLRDIEKVRTLKSLSTQLSPKTPEEIDQLSFPPISIETGEEGLLKRLAYLKNSGKNVSHVSGEKKLTDVSTLDGNIENFIGMAQIPIGLAGPILVNGKDAEGDFMVPLATTEGALVASYNRGMKACRLSGGITSVCLIEGVQRCPFFKFKTIVEVGMFISWIHQQTDKFHELVKECSRFATLNEVNSTIEGNSVIVSFEYLTGDASGQNMVTFCTDKICQYIIENFEIKPTEWYIESNYSGDKKATAVSFSNVRGKKVTAEVLIPESIVVGVLKSTPKQIASYWQSSCLAVTQAGAIGAQGHVANGLTALFIACGQDVACIAESSVGITRMEVTENGALYASVTLPALMVGTVGGGTSLPTQKECLELMDCYGVGKAKKFAEICCAVALAGELSIASALSAGHFSQAHASLGRKK
jgi:hydroxymethylglutaryl-CoA reductase (NADPH)